MLNLLFFILPYLQLIEICFPPHFSECSNYSNTGANSAAATAVGVVPVEALHIRTNYHAAVEGVGSDASDRSDSRRSHHHPGDPGVHP